MPPETKTPPTPLAERLAQHGTTPFRDYMAEALYGDEHGFYTQRDQPRLKRETSTLQTTRSIAETLAEAFARYAQTHEPHLVHHGPGTGRLTRYILATLPDWMHDEITITFIEPNLARRTRLLVLLQEFGVDGRVIATPHTLDDEPTFLIANERLGTFPVHRLEKTPNGWEEIHVRFHEDPWGWEETLQGCPPSIQRIANEHAPDTPTGHRYEPVDAAHQRRLPATRKPHDHEELAPSQLERHVVYADDVTGGLADRVLALARLEQAQRLAGVRAEDLRHVLGTYQDSSLLNIIRRQVAAKTLEHANRPTLTRCRLCYQERLRL